MYWKLIVLIEVMVLFFLLWHFITHRIAKKWRPKNSFVLITGGSKGMGRQIARCLLQNEAHIILMARNLNKLKEVQIGLDQKKKNKIYILSCDVSKECCLKRKIGKKMREIGWKHLDAVVANAGVSGPIFFKDIQKRQMEYYMNINFWGCVRITKVALNYLEKSPQQARLLYVGSMLSLMGLPGQTSYVASKFALRGFTESLNYEIYPNILVSVVYPPDTETDQYLYEQKVMSNFPILYKIQGNSKLIKPDVCAKGIVEVLISGIYAQWWTLEGFMLFSFCQGMESRSHIGCSFLSLLFGWLLELISTSYSRYWHYLSERYNIRK